MTTVKISGECVCNQDGSCTVTVRPEEGAQCGCANLSLTMHCDEGCCSDKRCC